MKLKILCPCILLVIIIVLVAGSSCGLNSTTSSTTGTTLKTITTVAAVNSNVYTAIASVPMSNKGNVQISDGTTLKTFQYTELSTITTNPFTFLDVTFTLWSTITTTPGLQCFGPVNGGYNITFIDGSSEKMATYVLVNPNSQSQIKLTNHVNPQAGLLINTTTRTIYFLVSP